MKKSFACLALCLCLFVGVALPARAAAAPAADAIVEITDRAGLEAIAQNPDGHYRLAAHIDMGGAAWQPIPFNGIFDGDGFALYNLTIRAADPVTAVSVDGNRLPYDTQFAALFSRCVSASIQDLTLLGADVALETDQSAYAAGLVGYGENVTLTGCNVWGRVALTVGGPMCGVAGVMGFGYGSITGCTAVADLTLVDTDDTANCEEFMGAILASGYADIEDCTVKLEAWTSVHGYVHNGGVVGMYYVHTDDTGHPGYVRNNTVDATIHFFEDVASRRAYSAPVIGEQMHWVLEIANNTTLQFESDEHTDYSTPLLPESCAAPAYTEAVTAPNCTSFGHTTHTCTGCGYSYTDSYAGPAHTPGDWLVTTPAAAGQNGQREQACTLCGVVIT
ncbi:MAG: hypothetical protein GXY32_10980, partial [Ruminococcaceae bacterium]|nr:hypothetical protein [Oscillospiraceae bacterium]